jgi:hypothetical protein
MRHQHVLFWGGLQGALALALTITPLLRRLGKIK